LLKALITPDGINHLFDMRVINHYWSENESWFSYLHYYYAMNLVEHPKIRVAIYNHVLQSLHNPNAHVRRYASELLGWYGKEGGKAVPELIHALLEDKYYRVRYYSAQSLKMIGEHCIEAKQAIPALKRALQDPDYSVRKHSQEALDFLEKR
jgi:HEAT repeat protein